MAHQVKKLSKENATQFYPGKEFWIALDSPLAKFSAAFEDDGQTGYLYVVKRKPRGKPEIIGAFEIYNVNDVVDHDTPSTVRLLWSSDGMKVGLIINNHIRAIYDMAADQGFSVAAMSQRAASKLLTGIPALQERERKMLHNLKREGSNLRLPHPIDHFIYFPTPAAAREAQHILKDWGFKVSPPDRVKGRWSTQATRTMVLSKENVALTIDTMERLAGRLKGEYDGWGTPIIN